MKRFKILGATFAAVMLLTVIGTGVVSAKTLTTELPASAAVSDCSPWYGHGWCYGDDDDDSPSGDTTGGWSFRGGFCH